MNHPDYRPRVIELSEETGSKDRLNCRRIAAGKLFQDLPEEERQNILDTIEEAHKEAMEAYEEVNDQEAGGVSKGKEKKPSKEQIARYVRP
jgi:hypothetical protein